MAERGTWPCPNGQPRSPRASSGQGRCLPSICALRRLASARIPREGKSKSMSSVIVKRVPRVPGPSMPEGQIELAEPPVLGEPATADLGSMVGMMPMALGMGAMALMFSVENGSKTTYLTSGMMGMSMISMGVGQLGPQRHRSASAGCARSAATTCATSPSCASRPRRRADEQRPAARLGQPGPAGAVVVGAGPPSVGTTRQATRTSAGCASALGRRRAAAGVHPAADQADRGPRTVVRDLAAPLRPRPTRPCRACRSPSGCAASPASSSPARPSRRRRCCGR